MGLPKFNNAKGIGEKPLPPVSLFGEDGSILLLGSCNPIHPEKSKVNINSENHGYGPQLQ